VVDKFIEGLKHKDFGNDAQWFNSLAGTQRKALEALGATTPERQLAPVLDGSRERGAPGRRWRALPPEQQGQTFAAIDQSQLARFLRAQAAVGVGATHVHLKLAWTAQEEAKLVTEGPVERGQAGRWWRDDVQWFNSLAGTQREAVQELGATTPEKQLALVRDGPGQRGAAGRRWRSLSEKQQGQVAAAIDKSQLARFLRAHAAIGELAEACHADLAE
jgi:hypothetical protein